MKTQQLDEATKNCLFVTYTVIQSITRSEMCALLFNPSKSTHTWSSGLTHTHLEPVVTHTHTTGAVDTYTHGAVDTHLEQRTHTHTHTHTPPGAGAHTHLGPEGTHTTHTTHTHTHLEQWAHTHTHTPGAVENTHTHTHTTHTHLEQWAVTLRRPGGSWGFSALLKGSHLSCGQFLPEPRTHNLRLQVQRFYPLGLHLDFNLQLYCVTHIQCGSVKSNAI